MSALPTTVQKLAWVLPLTPSAYLMRGASFRLFYSSVVFVDYRYNYYDCISGAASGQNDEKTDHEIA